jgi:hypothetical protein
VKEGLDGGEATLEAFRDLGIDYIISSSGSEWAPVWEALARQQVNETAGRCYGPGLHQGYWTGPGRPAPCRGGAPARFHLPFTAHS